MRTADEEAGKAVPSRTPSRRPSHNQDAKQAQAQQQQNVKNILSKESLTESQEKDAASTTRAIQFAIDSPESFDGQGSENPDSGDDKMPGGIPKFSIDLINQNDRDVEDVKGNRWDEDDSMTDAALRRGGKRASSIAGRSDGGRHDDQGSDDDEDSDTSPKHTSDESGSLILPWKYVSRKLEKIAARQFGMAKVREVRSTKSTAVADATTTQFAASGTDYASVASGVGGAGKLTNKDRISQPVRQGTIVIKHESETTRRLAMPSNEKGMNSRKNVSGMPSDDMTGTLVGSSSFANLLDDIEAASPNSNNNGDSGSNGGSLNVSIPHGCQLVRSMLHQKTILKSVVYMPFGETERFASADQHYAHVWRGPTHVLRLGTRQSRDAQPTSVTGINRWVYIQKWRVLIISTLHLELKILDPTLKVLSAIASPKPIISLEFIETYDELVAGGVGSITIWRFEKNKSSNGSIVTFKEPRICIEDLQIDEWVTFTTYDKTRGLLYAVFENNVNIYNYDTATRVGAMRHIHEGSISAVLLYEPLGYFITGGKDSIIKVWNQQNYLLYEFKDHSNTITGLTLVRGAGSRDTSNILSCSIDGTIRMWDLENGRFIYKMDTLVECLGMEWMHDDHFYSFSNERISVWYLSRFFSTYTLSNSTVVRLARHTADGLPARILFAAKDCSTGLISTRTGERLVTAFPVMAETSIVDAVYDILQDRIYVLTGNGDMTIYSSFSNPCTILEEWKHIPSSTQERMVCICGLIVSNKDVDPSEINGKRLSVPLLFGATESGQIVVRESANVERQTVLVQAHAGVIHSIHADPLGDYLFTSSADGTVKIWSVEFLEIAGGSSKAMQFIRHRKTGGRAHMRLALSGTIVSSHNDGNPQLLSYNPKFQILAVSMQNHAIRFYAIGTDKQTRVLRQHHRDEDHTHRITNLVCIDSPSICLFVSSSEDSTVRIWDAMSSSLVREMQFGETTWSVCFANSRGDILVGMSNQIVLVPVQGYMPARQLLQILERDWPDDAIESSTAFDTTLDFWKIYREKIKASGEQALLWHVPDANQQKSRPRTSELEKFERERRRRGKNAGTNFTRLNEVINSLDQSGNAGRDDADTGKGHGNSDDENGSIKQKRRVFDEDADASQSNIEVPEMSFEQLMRTNEEMRQRIEKNLQLKKEEASLKEKSNDPFEKFTQPTVVKKERVLDNLASVNPVLNQVTQAMTQAQSSVFIIRPKHEAPDQTISQQLALDKPRELTIPREKVLEVLERARARQELQRVQELKQRNERSDRVGMTPNQKMVQRKGWIMDRMAKMGVAPNSVITADLSKMQELVRAQQKRDLEEREQLARMRRLALENLYKAIPHKASKSEQGSSPRNAAQQGRTAGRSSHKGSVDLDSSDASSETSHTSEKENEQEKPPDDKSSSKAERKGKDGRSVKIKLRQKSQEPLHQEQEEPETASVTYEDIFQPLESKPESPNKQKPSRRRKARGAHGRVYIAPQKSPHDMPVAIESSDASAAQEPSPSHPPLQDPQLSSVSEPIQKDITMSGSDVNIEGDDLPQGLDSSQADIMPPEQSDSDPTPLQPLQIPRQSTFLGQKGASHRRKQALGATDTDPETSAQDEDESASATGLTLGDEAAPIADTKNSAAQTFDASPVSILEITDEVASKLSWDLFKTTFVRSKEPNAQQRVLDQLASTNWYRGIEPSKEVNITNIVDSIFNVLKDGYWGEKVQAAKALLYVFHTFREDFIDPINQIVNPQLEHIQDESWQVRTQIINNLASLQLFNEDMVLALILSLADKNTRVVKAAINTLGMFGISSKFALRNAMIQYHMIQPPTDEASKVDPLEELAKRLLSCETAAKPLRDFNNIFLWLDRIDKRIYGRAFERPDSATITLFPHWTEMEKARKRILKEEKFQAMKRYGMKRAHHALPPLENRILRATGLTQLKALVHVSQKGNHTKKHATSRHQNHPVVVHGYLHQSLNQAVMSSPQALSQYKQHMQLQQLHRLHQLHQQKLMLDNLQHQLQHDQDPN